jgi:hypothetical protein
MVDMRESDILAGRRATFSTLSAMSYVDRFRVKPRTRVNLARTKTDETGSFDGRRAAETRLEAIRASLAELQDRLYAQNRWAVLAVCQAMDAGG